MIKADTATATHISTAMATDTVMATTTNQN